jgi:hypothetical protein
MSTSASLTFTHFRCLSWPLIGGLPLLMRGSGYTGLHPAADRIKVTEHCCKGFESVESVFEVIFCHTKVI